MLAGDLLRLQISYRELRASQGRDITFLLGYSGSRRAASACHRGADADAYSRAVGAGRGVGAGVDRRFPSAAATSPSISRCCSG